MRKLALLFLVGARLWAAPWVVGYFVNQQIPVGSIPWQNVTIGIGSTVTTNTNCTLDGTPLGNISSFVSGAHAAGKKVLFAIGDGGSGPLGTCTNGANLTGYVTNLVNFLNANGFDGIDIDWENTFNQTQFVSLVNALDAQIHPGKLISFPPADNQNSKPAGAAAVASKLDMVNIQCYDKDIGAPQSWYVGAIHTGNSGFGACDNISQIFVTAGVPAAKIGVLMPTYGRQWNNCSAVLQSGCTSTGSQTFYNTIPGNSTCQANYHFDSTFGANYCLVGGAWLNFDGPEFIKPWVAWANGQGYGGFGFFSFDYEYMSGQSGSKQFPLSTLLWTAVNCPTCLYIDYENGSDSFDGTGEINNSTGSTVGPWKHAPGMLGVNNSNVSTGDGCTATCASHTPVAGDRFIFKGGVVWPYTTLPIQLHWGGTSTTSGAYGCAGAGCIYYGYDPAWNKGIVNSVTLKRDLAGCTSAPTVAFSGGGGVNAAATASIMPSAAGAVESNVAGLVTKVVVTNQGSGYTSNPSVTITGGSCTGITAVADITRPILDMGLNVPFAWNVGAAPNFSTRVWGPGWNITSGGFYIIDNFEMRNLLNHARGATGCASSPQGQTTTGFIDDNASSPTGHNTFSNNYIHNRNTDCSDNVGGQNQVDGDVAINTQGSDEVVGNFVTNGETLFLANGGANACVGTGSATAGLPCEFSEHSIYGNGSYVHGNYIYGARWLGHMGGNPSTAAIWANNEGWLVLYDNGLAHQNEFYFLYTTGTLYEYNNIHHSAVSGASNQQQTGNGTTQYFFNNISWDIGGGTPNYGLNTNFQNGPTANHLFFYNNTMFAGFASEQCINSDSGSTNSSITVTLQNNHCITNANPYFQNAATGSTWQNQAGSTVAANIQSASQVDAYNQSAYTRAGLFSPPNVSSSTVTFAGGTGTANLTSVCNGQANPGLGALCFDINGVARPSSGGWQAGAFIFTGNIVPPSLGPWTNGQTINTTLTCSNCAAASWAVSTGSLPTGLGINSSTGLISGVISAAGTFIPNVTFGSINQAYTITVNATPAITTISLPSGATGTSYSATIQTSGGTGAITFSITSGVLPTGLSLNTTTGVISGTPTVANNFPFSVTITDANGVSGQAQNLSITINGNCAITPTTLTYTARSPVSTQFVATGCNVSTFTLFAGSLAGSGLSLSPGGILSGTAAAGTFNFTVAYDIGTDPIVFTILPSTVGGATMNTRAGVQGKAGLK